MAVAPTGAIYKAMTIDGESSRTYGVYITGQAVYNAPQREVEMISVPGRNGQLALDKGRFENIEVTYPAGIYADTEAEFAEAVSNFRNFLCSRDGYVRIEDEYNPNEYRMGVYKSGLEVTPAMLKAGEFEIIFDCKPQRWLTEGETAVTIGEWGETETATGDIVTVENEDGVLGVKSLSVDLQPIQDLHGYDKPWSAGNGKNLFNDSYFIQNQTDASGNPMPDPYSLSSGVFTISTNVQNTGRRFLNKKQMAVGTYTFSFTPTLSGTNKEIGYSVRDMDSLTNIVATTLATITDGTRMSFTFTVSTSANIAISLQPKENASGTLTFKNVQLESGSTMTAYEPYSNICPISGRTEVVTNVAGKNLLDNNGLSDYATWESLGSANYAKPLNLPKNTQVTINGQHTVPSGLNSYVYLQRFDGTDWQNVRTLWQANASSMPYTFDTGDSPYRLWAYNPTASIATIDWMQIEEGSTATSYEPYDGTTYTTSLGQTVYGGTLDVVSGELVVDRAMVMLDGSNDEVWSTKTALSNAFSFVDSSIKDGLSQASIHVLSNYLEGKTQNEIAGSASRYGVSQFAWGTQLVVRIPNITSLTDLKAYLANNPLQVVYELAEPQTIQLTPQEIHALLGQNNIWADSGSVEVVYQMQIPQGEDYQYPLEGIYQLIYRAEDKCGNIGRGTRNIIVADETFRTVVYDDGTLIINESSYDTASNLVKHGAVKAVYDPMLEDGSNYVFNQNTPWTQNWTVSNSITRAEIGSVIRPISTAYWFYNLRHLEEFDLSKLDTSRVTDMTYMFGYVSYFSPDDTEVVLDLSNFDTRAVTNMTNMFNHANRLVSVDVSSFDTSGVNRLTKMFAYCNNLETIYALGAFSTGQLQDSTEMFIDCTKLVGGNGTAYSSSHMNYEYARLDNPPTEPGYFTAKE